MFDSITHKALESLWKELERSLESELAEGFLEILLRVIQAALLLSHDYRKCIQGFSGKYQFLSKDGGLTVAAVFNDGKLSVKEGIIKDRNVTVTFANGRALFNFLLSPNPDILGAMLRHEVETDGNLNYIYRFGFMGKRLMLMMTGQ